MITSHQESISTISKNNQSASLTKDLRIQCYQAVETELKRLGSLALADTKADTNQLLYYLKQCIKQTDVVISSYVWNLTPSQEEQQIDDPSLQFPFEQFLQVFLLDAENKMFLLPILLKRDHFVGIIFIKSTIGFELTYFNPTGTTNLAHSGEDQEVVEKTKQVLSSLVNHEIISKLYPKGLDISALLQQCLILSDQQQINGIDCAYIVGQTLVEMALGQPLGINKFDPKNMKMYAKSIAQARASFCDPHIVGEKHAQYVIRHQLVFRLGRALAFNEEYAQRVRGYVKWASDQCGLNLAILAVVRQLVMKIDANDLTDVEGTLLDDKAINFLSTSKILNQLPLHELKEFCDRLLEPYFPEHGDVIFKLNGSRLKSSSQLESSDAKIAQALQTQEYQRLAFLPSFGSNLQLPIQKGKGWKIDVPHDDSCLFWAVALAYLIPVCQDNEKFLDRFTKLFGKSAIAKCEFIKPLIKSYNPFTNTDLFVNDGLNRLIREQFRSRVVEFMSENRDEFKQHWDNESNKRETTFDDYLAKMCDPHAWGGDLEIRAISELLECSIHLVAAGYTQDFPDVSSKVEATRDIKIEIIHVNADQALVGQGNHYHFMLTEEIIKVYQLAISGQVSQVPKTNINKEGNMDSDYQPYSLFANKSDRPVTSQSQISQTSPISTSKAIENEDLTKESVASEPPAALEWTFLQHENPKLYVRLNEGDTLLNSLNPLTSESARKTICQQAAQQYVELLKLAFAVESFNYEYQLIGYERLGNVYLQRQEYIHAIALYQFALAICLSEKKSSFKQSSEAYQALLSRAIKIVEKQILFLITDKKIAPSDVKLDQAHRDYLQGIRVYARARINRHDALSDMIKFRVSAEKSHLEKSSITEAALEREGLSIRQIYQQINEQLRGFVIIMLEECKRVLGLPPCQYAIICFGDLARDKATSYTKLEFGILIEDYLKTFEQLGTLFYKIEGKEYSYHEAASILTEQARVYFQKLTQLLNIKIINLGETLLRTQNIPELNEIMKLIEHNSNDFIKQGLCFSDNNEDNCITPLGNSCIDNIASENKFELILTPKKMAQLQNDNWYQKNKLLSMTLMTAVLLDGNAYLLETYQKEMNTILQSVSSAITAVEGSSQLTVAQQRALVGLAEHMQAQELAEIEVTKEKRRLIEVLFTTQSLNKPNVVLIQKQAEEYEKAKDKKSEDKESAPEFEAAIKLSLSGQTNEILDKSTGDNEDTSMQVTEVSATIAFAQSDNYLKKSPLIGMKDLHNALLKQFEPIISKHPENFETFLTAIHEKAYGKALRRACTASGKDVLDAVSILLDYKELLSININEQAGDKNFAAIHHAASKGNQVLYDLLTKHGANVNLLDKDGITAAEHLQRYQPRKGKVFVKH